MHTAVAAALQGSSKAKSYLLAEMVATPSGDVAFTVMAAPGTCGCIGFQGVNGLFILSTLTDSSNLQLLQVTAAVGDHHHQHTCSSICCPHADKLALQLQPLVHAHQLRMDTQHVNHCKLPGLQVHVWLT